MYVENGMHMADETDDSCAHMRCMHPRERGHVVTREWEYRTLKRDSFGSSLSLRSKSQIPTATAENCSVKTQKIGSQPSFCVKNTSSR